MCFVKIHQFGGNLKCFTTIHKCGNKCVLCKFKSANEYVLQRPNILKCLYKIEISESI